MEIPIATVDVSNCEKLLLIHNEFHLMAAGISLIFLELNGSVKPRQHYWDKLRLEPHSNFLEPFLNLLVNKLIQSKVFFAKLHVWA